MNFSINSLEIKADENTLNSNKEIYKNLSATKYVFNDFYQNDEAETERPTKPFSQNFFGENVNIQAIVGKNGSGKSSLMDVLYMIVNNFAFFLTKNLKLPAASNIYYIPNLYAEICFSIDGEKYILNCDGNKMDLKLENKKTFEFDLEDDNSFCDERKVKQIAQYFFFTIVSNYSLQSFISSNYTMEVYDYIQNQNNKSSNLQKCIDVTEIELKSHKCKYVKEKNSWIDSIFYKNDGYTCPIVLNPFRGKGTIDLNGEMELSKDRLTSLLIWFSSDKRYNDNSPFAPYTYAYIKIKEKEDFVIGKFREYFKNTKKFNSIKEIPEKNIINFIDVELKNGKSFLEKVLETFSIDSNEICDNVFKKKICAYLLLKLIFIPQRYIPYSNFKNAYEIKITDSQLVGEINDKEIIEMFLEKIESDKSHITKKIRRVVNFLKIPSNSIKSIVDINQFYEKYYLGKVRFSSPSEIDEHLPPSLFSYELSLKRQMEKGNKEEIVPYSALSSGEIQMLQTLSVHTYHIENLISVPYDDNRPKYRNINLVFDEVEICFHPEYQRQFVKRLLTVLNAIIEAEKENISFNIFIITHSPFILSDIPVSHVLFLEDGRPCGEKHPETFAGNIGEMFYDSFFLESTIGAFAEEKIKCLIQKRQGVETMFTEEAKSLLECIGDPVIKALIKETCEGKFDDKN